MSRFVLIAALLVVLVVAGGVFWARVAGLQDPRDTEVWALVPPVVEPGPERSKPPPADALVLFGGTGLSEWEAMDGSPARWTVDQGVMTVKKGAGNIWTRRRFRDYRLHIEWRVPAGIRGSGQWRGNSGLFLGSTGNGDSGYEIQILDSYRNETYVNGQAGAVYKQFAPLANPMRPPGEWQSYDVTWIAPRFAEDRSLASPGIVTVFMNGILIQDHVKLLGETVFMGKPAYHAHGRLPIMLQDHRDPSAPVSFRNIWVREIEPSR